MWGGGALVSFSLLVSSCHSICTPSPCVHVQRNVLPVLNNLLENREMALEDGRFLVSPVRLEYLCVCACVRACACSCLVQNAVLFSSWRVNLAPSTTTMP